MPADYEIDLGRRLVLSRAWGVFTPQDLFDHFARLSADPDFDPAYSQLVDLRDVERTELTPPIIRRHALERLFDSTAQRALVVIIPYHYELARIYADFARFSSQNVRVFREMHDAEEWLGIAAHVT